MGSPEILIVANRLPVSWAHQPGGERELVASPGGLVSALAPVASQLECTWLGWLDERPATELIVDGMRLLTVAPTPEQFDDYYQGFANQVLWPIFHGLPEHAAAVSDGRVLRWWAAYQQVNQIFADRVAKTAASGALIWVHDYHLLLVPRLLREMRPDLRVAVFLHIPFPEFEAFGAESWARELVAGVRAADFIGVQRETDVERLRAALLAFEQAGPPDTQLGSQPVPSPSIRALPISIDAVPYEDDAREALGAGNPSQFRLEHGLENRPMLLSVDRLDYTKGILERLAAFEDVLEKWDATSPYPTLVQVITPTRENIPAYRDHAAQVQRATERVCARFTAPGYTPIISLTDPHTPRDLVQLYLAADVMVVTPLRDGMNLVAKEFSVTRLDGRGVLVLGRGAGAADELEEALLVDASNHSELVGVLTRALRLSPEETSARVQALGAHVREHDVYTWADAFLAAARAPQR